MRIGILGTGVVGRTLAAKLDELGHAVVCGTRAPRQTLARTHRDRYGHLPFAGWWRAHPHVGLVRFCEAAEHGQLVVNATAGAASLQALRLAQERHLDGKVLLDVANPLDYSRGTPPSLLVCNTDSLA